MNTVTTVQENAEDVLEEAKKINEERAAQKAAMEVSVLDAVAIGVSMLRGNIDTAGSVMFLLGIGELLEEWTHKKSVGDLARSMS